MSEERDYSPCPRCGEWIEDPGEFGVLRHEGCGYCAHPSRDWCHVGWVCVVCGDLKPDSPRKVVAMENDCFLHGPYDGSSIFCPTCERSAGR